MDAIMWMHASLDIWLVIWEIIVAHMWSALFQILIQIIAWGFIFPIGMVLGMTKYVFGLCIVTRQRTIDSMNDLHDSLLRSRWHVPLQSTGIALTVLGIIFGHTHKGRKFPYTASVAFLPLFQNCWLLIPTGALFQQAHGTMAKIITFQLIAVSITTTNQSAVIFETYFGTK